MGMVTRPSPKISPTLSLLSQLRMVSGADQASRGYLKERLINALFMRSSSMLGMGCFFQGCDFAHFASNSSSILL